MISVLNKGDIVFVDFKGSLGREQGGTRPALVMSSGNYHEISSTAVVIPITSNTSPWPFKVVIPDNERVMGAILVDQLKSLDRHNRGFKRIARLDEDTIEKVDEIIITFLALKGAQNGQR